MIPFLPTARTSDGSPVAAGMAVGSSVFLRYLDEEESPRGRVPGRRSPGHAAPLFWRGPGLSIRVTCYGMLPLPKVDLKTLPSWGLDFGAPLRIRWHLAGRGARGWFLIGL